MSEVFIRNFNVPANCMECEWRDAEACEECELMIGNPFLPLEEQFAHCPFRVIAKRHPLVPVQPHGRLIDGDALEKDFREDAEDAWNKQASPISWADAFDELADMVADVPTILEAEEGET